MKIKGMNKDMTCRGQQYKEDEIVEIEGSPIVCGERGIHYVENPHDVFGYYAPGLSRYFEVEPLGEVSRKQGENEDSKCCTNKIRIGAEVSVKAICQFSVKAFFERFKFKEKIESADTNNAGDCGAANAGYKGAANAGDCGAANAGDYGAANAGDYGAANAGYKGAANAGYKGAANAGDKGAANAGYCGAANAGNYGAAIVQTEGSATVGEKGIAIGAGNGAKAKGQEGAVLILFCRDDDYNVTDVKTLVVGKDGIKPDIWYSVVNGEVTEASK